MSASLQRGACPGLATPMATGDGLLARLTPRDGIALDALIGLCAAARRHGNGTIEVTARGNLQVRGLTPVSAPRFASAVAALAIPASDGVPVLVDPLPDDPNALIDTIALAEKLRLIIAAAQPTVAPKVSVIIDGGGRLHLDALAADIRLRATGTVEAPRLHVAIGGTAASARPLGSIAPAVAANAVAAMLDVIAARGRAARAADIIRSDGIDAFRSVLHGGIDPACVPPRRPSAEPIGQHPLRDSSVALGVVPAFGHTQAEALGELARIAATHGARSARAAPGRALLLVGIPAQAAVALAHAAERLGFIAQADDPRCRVVACPGTPACASGLIAARALAAEIAHAVAPGRGVIHVSGCAKGCAHPAAAVLTVVGTARGCGIVRNGPARATPHHIVDLADLVATVAHEVAGETAPLTDQQSEPVHG